MTTNASAAASIAAALLIFRLVVGLGKSSPRISKSVWLVWVVRARRPGVDLAHDEYTNHGLKPRRFPE